MNKLKKIDELTIDEHYYIVEGDLCYYFGEYTSNTSYNYSRTNNLISNFKKPISVNGTPQWKYKTNAILDVSKMLIDNLKFEDSSDIILVPIPPSKKKCDANYDDRLTKVLKRYENHTGVKLREVIKIKENMESFHAGARLNPSVLLSNLEIDESQCDFDKTTFILFDDVITTGSHFKACEQLLKSRFSKCRVIGVFIARRNFEEEN